MHVYRQFQSQRANHTAVSNKMATPVFYLQACKTELECSQLCEVMLILTFLILESYVRDREEETPPDIHIVIYSIHHLQNVFFLP